MFNIQNYKKYSSIIAVSSALLLSACHALPETDSQKSQQPDNVVNTVKETNIKTIKAKKLLAANHHNQSSNPEAIEACAAKGGEWRKQGMMQQYGCVLQYADAGKQCQDDSDCEGSCYGDGRIQAGLENQFGQCAKTSSIFGCRQKVINGVATPTICID